MVIDSSGEMVDVFEKFHITIKNQDGSLKSFENIFGQVRDKIQAAASASERMAIATQFFRGSAVELMPLLTMTGAQWKEIAEDARKYGIVISQDNVDSVRKYVMAHRDLDDAIQGLKLVIGAELLPFLTKSMTAQQDAIKSVRDFTSEHRKLLSLPWDAIKYASYNFTILAVAIAAVTLSAFSAQIVTALASLSSFSMGLTLTTTQARTLGIALAALAGIEIAKIITNYDEEMGRLNKNIQVATETHNGCSPQTRG